MAHTTTTVLVLKDFKITALPSMPSAYIGRIGQNVWREFQQQCQQRVNQTYGANNDLNKLARRRQCYQLGYWIGAPITCVAGYLSYYLIVLGLTWGAGLTAIGAILAILALASCATAIYTATTLGSMMKAYRFACQQDMDGVFAYMNQRYNNLVYFSTARSTHRNNGRVELGITVVLRVQNLNANMAQMVGTASGGTQIIQQPMGVMPVQVQQQYQQGYQQPMGQVIVPIQQQPVQQVQGVPVQLPNGQVVYQVNQPIQQKPQQQQYQQQQPVPIQIQQQQQQYQPPVAGAGQGPQYQPPPPVYNANASAQAPAAYGAVGGGGGEGEGAGGGNGNNGAQTGGYM